MSIQEPLQKYTEETSDPHADDSPAPDQKSHWPGEPGRSTGRQRRMAAFVAIVALAGLGFVATRDEGGAPTQTPETDTNQPVDDGSYARAEANRMETLRDLSSNQPTDDGS